jgi:hypothetical protein
MYGGGAMRVANGMATVAVVEAAVFGDVVEVAIVVVVAVSASRPAVTDTDTETLPLRF